MKKDLIIAIDGYSSTGKSTLAKNLAKKLNYKHLDSGAMYRAVTLFALNNNLISENEELNSKDLIKNLNKIKITFELNKKTGVNEIYLNEKNIEKEIREMRVAEQVSQVAKVAEVRTYLVNLQRKLAKNGGVVMDGRDIGTTVFPDADLKIFLNAGIEERAKRRHEELLAKGEKILFSEVIENITERDFTDLNRKVSPLKKADDAIEINNGKLSARQTLNRAWKLVEEKLN